MLISKLYVVYNPAPFIVIETSGGGTLRDEIEFNELGAYVKLLEDQQARLGKFVSFTKGVFVYNNKNMSAVIIGASDIPVPGLGIPVIVQLANDPDTPCDKNPEIVYTDIALPIAPGHTLYTNNILTVPLTGSNRVCVASTGEIFQLNTLTGVVGALTGGTCTTPPPVTPPLTLAMKIDGVDFDVANVLTGISNVSSITANKTVNATTAPTVFSFVLPRRTRNLLFLEEYEPTTAGAGVIFVEATAAGANWNCVGTYANGSANDTVDILKRDIVVVTQINNGGGQSLEFDFWTNAFDRQYAVGYVGAANLPVGFARDTDIYPITFANASKAGVYTVNKYRADGSFIEQQINVDTETTVTIPADCLTLEFIYKQLLFINNIVGSASKILITDWSLTGYAFAVIYDESNTPQYLRYPKGAGGGVAGTIGIAVIDPALLPLDVSFYRNGVLLNTVNVITQIQQLNPAAGNWDTLVFGAAAPPATKHVYLLNETGHEIRVETDTTTYIRAAGVNGDIEITPSGLFKVKTLGGFIDTYSFLQSMPATLDPNVVAPNPTALAFDATKAMPADMSTLNYIRCQP